MIELLAASRTNPVTEIVPILVLVAVIVICLTVWSVCTRSIEPWKRKYFKPSKQLRVDFVRVLIWKVRSHWPKAFDGPAPWDEQHIDVIGDLERLEYDAKPRLTDEQLRGS